MSYELRASETLGDGVRRVCCEQIKCAVEASKAVPGPTVSQVHATRRHLKKARAALRLISRHVQPADFKREHSNLRDVGRLISDVRDAEVRLGTVRHLRRQGRMQNDPALEETEDLLSFELESFFAAFSDWQKEAQMKLTGVRRRMARWHLVHLDCKQIRCSVQNSYKRGRQALLVATTSPTAENFHEFRKQVKELSFHVRILRPLHPSTFEAFTDELKILGEKLGQANDLAFLGDRLVALHGSNRLRHGQRKLSAILERRRDELQRGASELGQRFYIAPPKEFGQRIAEYFETWHRPDKGSNAVGPPRRPATRKGTAQCARRRSDHSVALPELTAASVTRRR